MIIYQSPEFTVLEIVAQDVICESKFEDWETEPATVDDTDLFDWE